MAAPVLLSKLRTMTYAVSGRVAFITLNRPARGNGITMEMPLELRTCVEAANEDPGVHVIGLSGAGRGFCGGYDLVESAEALESAADDQSQESYFAEGSPSRLEVLGANHDPAGTWDPILDFQMMKKNADGFMSLFHGHKPVVTKAHGFCVAGGTDMALCSDLLFVTADCAIGYPPARVWGVPTTGMWVHRVGLSRAKRLLLTGDKIDGQTALDWGLASHCEPDEPALDAAWRAMLERMSRIPVNQLVMHKLVCNQSVLNAGLASTQAMSVFFDGVARHTAEGYGFQARAAEAGFKAAVEERDGPFREGGWDYSRSRL